MNIAQIREYDVANGPGIRTTIFVSGCTHNCFACFNKEYQNFNFGKKFNREIKNEIINYVRKTKNLSVLGGEPMQQGKELVEFLKEVKETTNANIWVWTGYKLEEILESEDINKKDALMYIDILVDGKFIQHQKDLTLKFRGSSNQRIINVKKTLENNKIVLMEV